MPRESLSIARFTFIEALRNRLFWLVFVVLLAALGLTEFIGAIAITESIPIRAAFLGALLRFSAVFIVGLFVIASGVREFNEKGLELVLSLPLPRAGYYLGKLAGFSLFALLTALLCAAPLLFYAPAGQVLLWGVSLSCELLIVTAFSLLCLLTFRQVTLALSAVIGFYVLARSLAAIQLIGGGSLADAGSLAQQVINTTLAVIAFALPGLDRFTSSAWLVYHTGDWSSLAYVLGQTLVYLPLLAGAGLFDLYRREF